MKITLKIDEIIIKRLDELIKKGVFLDRDEAVNYILKGTIF